MSPPSSWVLYNQLMTSKELPSVSCLMMSTIDGKIGSGIPGVDVVDDYLDVYREIDNAIAGTVSTKGNAWICGRVTSQLYFTEGTKTPLPASTNTLADGDYIADAEGGRYFITTDTRGVLRWKTNSISFYPEHGNLHLIIVVNKSTPKKYLVYLRDKGISYLVENNDSVNFADVLSKVRENFQITKVLLEGGGKINGSFMKAGLIDEIYLLVIPRVINKTDAPSIFDNDTNTEAAFIDYNLLETKPMARGSVLLHYKKK